jgi:hypothetical protein
MCPLQARLNAMFPENHYSGAYSIPRVIPAANRCAAGHACDPDGDGEYGCHIDEFRFTGSSPR